MEEAILLRVYFITRNRARERAYVFRTFTWCSSLRFFRFSSLSWLASFCFTLSITCATIALISSINVLLMSSMLNLSETCTGTNWVSLHYTLMFAYAGSGRDSAPCTWAPPRRRSQSRSASRMPRSSRRSRSPLARSTRASPAWNWASASCNAKRDSSMYGALSRTVRITWLQ